MNLNLSLTLVDVKIVFKFEKKFKLILTAETRGKRVSCRMLAARRNIETTMRALRT